MVRIRYTSNNGELVSKDIIAGTEVVKVVIDVNNKRVEINTKERNVFYGYAETLSKLKILAKKELKNLGVVFGEEVRNRRTQ